MLKLGGLELGPVPRIAVPFTDLEPPEAVSAALARGADIAELRVDLFSSTTQGLYGWDLSRFRDLPTIGTIRAAAEGGGWSGAEATRLELFAALAPRVDALDIEFSSEALLGEVIAMAGEHGRLAIVSHHDFEATPELSRLSELCEAACAAGADLVKIATKVESPADLRSLAGLCFERPETPLIVVGMGRLGPVSRVLLPALGSLVTFASLDAESATAPGQLPLEEARAWLDRLFGAEGSGAGN